MKKVKLQQIIIFVLIAVMLYYIYLFFIHQQQL